MSEICKDCKKPIPYARELIGTINLKTKKSSPPRANRETHCFCWFTEHEEEDICLSCLLQTKDLIAEALGVG